MTKTLFLSVFILIFSGFRIIYSQADAGPDQEICTDSTYMQAVNPYPYIGFWTQLGGAGTIEDPTLYNSLVTGLSSGGNSFLWTVTIAGEEYYDDVLIINNSFSISSGFNSTICSDETVIHFNEYSEWELIAGCATFSDTVDNLIYLTDICQGENIFVETVTLHGCTASDTMSIINNRPDEAVIISPQNDTTICQDFLELEALEPVIGVGEWQILAGSGTFDNPTNNITTVNGLSLGSNMIRWIVTNEVCALYDEITITNNSFNAYAGTDQYLSQFVTSTYFEAELPPNSVGQWSILAGSGIITDLNSPSSYVDNMPFGENIFSWTVTNTTTGCSDSDDVSIFVVNIIFVCGTDQMICNNTTVMDADFVPGVDTIYHTWSRVSGTGDFDDIHDPKTVVRNIQIGTSVYKWTVNFVGYEASCTVNVTNDSIYAYAGDDVSLCEDYHTMNAQQIFGGTGEWSVVGLGGGTIVNNSAWNTLITNLEPGANHFLWYVTNGSCSSYDTVAITYNLPPVAQFEADPVEFVAPQEVVFTNTSDFWPGWTEPDEFRWSSDDMYLGTTYDLEEEVVYTFTNTGEADSVYYISLIAVDYETACTDTFVSNVLAHPEPESIFDIYSNFKIYPNPTAGLITLSSSTDLSDAIIGLTSISGQEVYYKLIEKTTNAYGIDLSHLAKGIYFLKIRLKGQTTMFKLVKK